MSSTIGNQMKTSKLSRITSVIFLSGLIAYAGVARAVTFVDPVNLVQNTRSAISQIKTEIQSASALAQQIKATIHLGKSIASKQGLAEIAGVSKELQLYNELKNTDLDLKRYAEKSLDLSQNLLAKYGASEMSWTEFTLQRAKVNSLQNQVMVGQYKSLTASLDETARRRQVIVNELQSATGETSATQAVGAAVDVLIGQNQQMISALATKTGIETAKINEDEEMRKQWQKRMDDHQKKMSAEARKY